MVRVVIDEDREDHREMETRIARDLEKWGIAPASALAVVIPAPVPFYTSGTSLLSQAQ